MPGSWSHQDWCPTPSGHDGDCWMENNRVLGIKPIPDGELPIDIVDARDPYEVYGTPEHESWLIEMEEREG